MFVKKKAKKVLSTIVLVLILLAILISPIVLYILFNKKTDPINLSGLITLALFLGLALLLFATIRSSNNQITVQNKTIRYFISMLLLLVFLSLFISSFGLYSLWAAIFKFLPAVCIIGLVFIFALTLIFFIKDLGYAIIFTLPILMYPFTFINSYVSYLALGSIISGLTVGNIMVQYINLSSKFKLINKKVTKKLFYSSLKVFLLSLTVSSVLFFTLANDFKSFYVDTLDLKFKEILLNLIPLAIVLFLLIFNLDYLYVFLIGIIAQSVIGFTLKMFIPGFAYNSLRFLLFDWQLLHLSSELFYLISWCQSLFWFFIIVIFYGLKKLYAEFIANLTITDQIYHQFCTYSPTMTLAVKTNFYKKSILNLCLKDSTLEETITLILQKSDKQEIPQHMIVYTMLSQINSQIISVFLPFSLINFWRLLSTANSFSIPLLSGYIMLFKGFWSGYFLIFFINLFIFFNKLQDIWFKNWISQIRLEFSIHNPSSRW